MSSIHTSEVAPWPAYPSSSEYAHALGILSVNFNDLENKLLDLLKLYSGAPDDVTAFIFEKFNSKELKLQFLDYLLGRRKLRSQRLLKAIEEFSKAYSTCANNRNFILHSRLSAQWSGTETYMLSKRARKHGGENHRDVDLSQIRRSADEIHIWNAFANNVIFYILRKKRARQKKFARPGLRLVGPTTLPKIPSQPTDLEASFQSTQSKRRSQPQSSP